MGSGIVKNLLNSGHNVTVWNRTTEKVRAEFVMGPKGHVSREFEHKIGKLLLGLHYWVGTDSNFPDPDSIESLIGLLPDLDKIIIYGAKKCPVRCIIINSLGHLVR
jgi:hypothetical protein